MGAMGMGRRESTRVPALRVSVLLMGLREAARAPDQPSEASTPSESTTPDSAGVRAPPGCRARQVARGFKTWLEGLFSHPTRSDFPGGAEAVRPTARQISSLRVRRTWPTRGARLRRTCRSCKRVSSFITDTTDAKQRPLPHRELHEAGGAAWRL